MAKRITTAEVAVDNLNQKLNQLPELPDPPDKKYADDPAWKLLVAGINLFMGRIGVEPEEDVIESSVTDAHWGYPASEDLGIDGIYIDSDNEEIVLFHSKYLANGTVFKESELDTFTAVTKRLTDPEHVSRVSRTNQRIAEAILDIYQNLKDGYGFKLVFITTSIVNAKAESTVAN